MHLHRHRSSKAVRLVLVVLGLLLPAHAKAGSIYQVSADTTAIQGVSGSFDIQFNPGGLGTLAATATVTNFLTNGTGLSLNTTDGGVSGTLLPGPLSINNTQAFNDLLENITFGTSISFTLVLSGPGVSSPSSILPGTSFGLSLYDANFNPLLTTDPSGTVITVNLNPNGSSSVQTFPSSDSGGAPVGNASPQALATPEPSSLLLLLTGLVGLGAYSPMKRVLRNVRRPIVL